jgi:ADP-ribose pyrophosphatase
MIPQIEKNTSQGGIIMEKNIKSSVEKTLESEMVFKGKFFGIRRHQVILPDGKKAVREIAEHPGAAGCVVLNEKNEILLVKQYRKAAEQVLAEIPAGKIDKNESPESCVVREVEEETGIIITEPLKLSEFYPSPGFTTEKMFIYLAKAKDRGETHQMDDECIWSGFVPFHQAFDMIKTGEVQDAKTIIGILCAKEKLKITC